MLGKLGYESEFVQKTRGKLDGCLIAWTKKRFAKVRSLNIDLDGEISLYISERDNKRFMRHNVGIVVELQEVANGGGDGGSSGSSSPRGGRIVVATTHLFWDPRYSMMLRWIVSHVSPTHSVQITSPISLQVS